MIATRAPEGEPLKCLICGAIHLVLVSDPPSDSVCPSCGAFSWIKVVLKPAPFLNEKQCEILRQLLNKIQSSQSRTEACQLLVDGISVLLDIESIGVSIFERDSFEPRLIEIARRGQFDKAGADADALNNIQVEQQPSVFRNVSCISHLPLKRHDYSLAGIIAMERPSTLSDDQVAEEIRVVASIGAVALGTHLFD